MAKLKIPELHLRSPKSNLDDRNCSNELSDPEILFNCNDSRLSYWEVSELIFWFSVVVSVIYLIYKNENRKLSLIDWILQLPLMILIVGSLSFALYSTWYIISSWFVDKNSIIFLDGVVFFSSFLFFAISALIFKKFISSLTELLVALTKGFLVILALGLFVFVMFGLLDLMG